MKQAAIFPAEFSLSASSSREAAAIMKHSRQRVLADFGGQLDEHREQAHQNEADPAHRGTQKPGQPAKKYPAEDRARDH